MNSVSRVFPSLTVATLNLAITRPKVNEIFRKEFGFGDGVIISDCNDIEALIDFRVASNLSHAAAAALNGGVDWDLQCGGQSAYTTLDEAMANGMVDEATLDTVVSRILQQKFALGLFDNPIVSSAGLAGINSPAHVVRWSVLATIRVLLEECCSIHRMLLWVTPYTCVIQQHASQASLFRQLSSFALTIDH
jgi:beta-glucosidase-like glycosyl hydrolase